MSGAVPTLDELEKRVAAASRARASVAGVVTGAEQEADQAAKLLDARDVEIARVNAARDEAERVYANAEHTDAAAARLHNHHDACRLAEARRRAAAEKHTAAQGALQTARDTLAAKEAEEDDAKRTLAGSAALLHQRADAHALAALASVRALLDSLRGVDDAVRAAVKAGGRVDSTHAMLAALESLADQGHAVDEYDLRALRDATDQTVNSGHSGAVARAGDIVGLIVRILTKPKGAGTSANARRVLELVRQKNTYGEALRHLADEGREAETRRRAASAGGPRVAAPGWKRANERPRAANEED